MSARAVDVDGTPWQDGWVGVDADGVLWRLRFVPSSWGPVHDYWSWQRFGEQAEELLDSDAVKHPLKQIWPAAAKRRPTENPSD